MKKSFKYRILLGLCRLFRTQRIMELPPNKIQKLFGKSFNGAIIPKMDSDLIDIGEDIVLGSTCLWYRNKKCNDRACIYLVGGGMLHYPKPRMAKEVMILAEKTGVDFVLPYYPLVYTGNTLLDVYGMIYVLYKQILNKYTAENVFFLGSSSGANLALGMISYINDRGEGLPTPGKVYAGSPGSLLVTEEEKKKASSLDKTDVIMSQKATLSVWEGMTGGKKVPQYMESLQLGDYTGLRDVYLSFGGDEVFAAAADSIKARLEQFGAHVTMEVAPGMYHCYSTIPLVKDAMPGYYRMLEYIKGKNINNKFAMG
jgi:monoterpene epsilon-lactone hydrolase